MFFICILRYVALKNIYHKKENKLHWVVLLKYNYFRTRKACGTFTACLPVFFPLRFIKPPQTH